MRRTVGARAAARHGVGLPELMRAGLLVAGDTLSFAYGGRTHIATLTADALIAVDGGGGAAPNTHAAPTHWALACVNEYWRGAASGTRPSTNPSGYTRVRSVRHNCTLNALRDRVVGAVVAVPATATTAPTAVEVPPPAKRRRTMAAKVAATQQLARPESLGEACARRGSAGTVNRKRGYKALGACALPRAPPLSLDWRSHGHAGGRGAVGAHGTGARGGAARAGCAGGQRGRRDGGDGARVRASHLCHDS